MTVMRLIGLAIMCWAVPAHAVMDDEPLLYSFNAHEFEWRQQSGDGKFAWDVEAWRVG